MIKLEKVTKKYGNTLILDQADYTFPQKGIVCLMGASGCGKTTLLNLLAGFDTDYTGTIQVGGTAINKMNPDELCCYRKDHVGFVFQNYHLLPGYTVLENVMLSCDLIDETCDLSLQKATTLLSRLGLSEKENQKIETLSGGQKQRVAIARALMSTPKVLFADEPTGALDRTTSTEIMTLLREIAQDRLVVVITHDPKICDFADEVIHIKDGKIIGKQNTSCEQNIESSLAPSIAVKTPCFTRAIKNFKIHLKCYVGVSFALAIGILAFLFSLSFSNITNQSIENFKEKNTAFNNGYIKGVDDGSLLTYLNSDERIENVYYQYILNDVSLFTNGTTQAIEEKFPTPKTGESLSYGIMPRLGKNEIALTPSLAKKFDTNIEKLVGQLLTITFQDQQYALTICGIYNAGYDDFIISSDVEQQLYATLPPQNNYALSYDVKNFSDIVAVSNNLQLRGTPSINASKEVAALQTTFNNLNKMFVVISIIIFGIGLFVCSILLFKLQNSRYHEVGLLSALGFNKHQITALFTVENLILSTLSTLITLLCLVCSLLMSSLLNLSLSITGSQILLSLISAFCIIMLMSQIASYKLIRTEPAVALKK